MHVMKNFQKEGRGGKGEVLNFVSPEVLKFVSQKKNIKKFLVFY